jgi:cytidylate kinase
MPVITVSASYGSGGSRVAPRLAERVGARLLDRAIPVEVAEQMAVPLEQAQRRDQTTVSAVERFVARFAAAGMAYGALAPDDLENILQDEGSYTRAAEKVIRDHAQQGDVVILGRAAAIVLREQPDVFHLRLDGPPAARAARAMTVRGISHSEAQRQLMLTDQAREAYVRHFYKCDPRDARHYHIVLDATAYQFDDLVDVIVYAHRAWQASRTAPPGAV